MPPVRLRPGGATPIPKNKKAGAYRSDTGFLCVGVEVAAGTVFVMPMLKMEYNSGEGTVHESVVKVPVN